MLTAAGGLERWRYLATGKRLRDPPHRERRERGEAEDHDREQDRHRHDEPPRSLVPAGPPLSKSSAGVD